MAALSRASSRNDVAHGNDSDYCWRGGGWAVGKAYLLADGHRCGTVAFVRRPLGGDMVPQLAASAPLQRTWRSSFGSPRGLVFGWHCLAIGMRLTVMVL